MATSGLGLPDSCGPSLARIVPDNWGLLSRCLLLRNELSMSFPHEELGAWACVAHVAYRCLFLGWLLLSQGILTLGQALSLQPGLLNVVDGEALSMKLVCATLRFLLLILLSPGGELAVVARLLTVVSRWLGAIQNYLPLL